MQKFREIFGVDISKDTFDVFSSKGNHAQFPNNLSGFRAFLKTVSKKSHVVMEATGYYHFSLAQFLHKRKRSVSVVNPILVKRFIQMKLIKVKTDKSDARMICAFAMQNPTPPYFFKTQTQSECLELMSLMQVHSKDTIAYKARLKGQLAMGAPCAMVVQSIERILEYLKTETARLEQRLSELIRAEEQEQLDLLQSIPGIGQKTAIMLIVLTDGFRRFEHASQLCSWVGITPLLKISGSSVRGKSRISKFGNKKMRRLLFLCSFSAYKHNRACRELYERITAKGKSKKLALIAVCNKLLKQAFAIVTSKIPYSDSRALKPALRRAHNSGGASPC